MSRAMLKCPECGMLSGCVTQTSRGFDGPRSPAVFAICGHPFDGTQPEIVPAEATVENVVHLYRWAMRNEPHRATRVIANELGVSRATVIRRLQTARDRGLIPVPGFHRPAMARLANSFADEPSWIACVGCHQPWPCPDAPRELVG